jgi:hypothetical protein
MAAPKGNQFWKIRSTHGREKLFESPEQLLTACEEYFNWVDAHPWYKVEQAKKPFLDTKSGEWVTIIKMPTPRPYTIQGLCRYLNCNTVWFNQFEKSLEGKTDKSSQDFSKIVTHVREAIYQQKLEGAAVGAFNGNIIARELGLKEKAELTGKDDQPLYPEGGSVDVSKLSPEVLKSLYHAIKRD